MLVKAARLLSPLQEDFVYLGGLALALLISDPAAPDVRPTEDVDVIVEVATYAKYAQLEERLYSDAASQSHQPLLLSRMQAIADSLPQIS